MGRPKEDKRPYQSCSRTRNVQRAKYNSYSPDGTHAKRLSAALVSYNGNLGKTAIRHKIPKTTLHRELKNLQKSKQSISTYIKQRSDRLVLLNVEEQDAVVKYCLWQSDRGMNLTNTDIKGMIREIHSRAVDGGANRQPINKFTGPSAKFMRGFYQRHAQLSYRSSEPVDRNRVNNATEETIAQYFELLKTSLVNDGILSLDEAGNPIQESIKAERIYLADETGWGVATKNKKVIGRKGSKHVYNRKPSDESHKTLMLGICGNGDVLKPLIILEKSFPLIAEGEAEHIPDDILLSKTDKGSMEKELFVNWIEAAVIPHKHLNNPDGVSYLIVDNHGSRFSSEAIDLCTANCIEMLCYPGHLTHILQGPDVVLNKPLSTQVGNMVHRNPQISGNSDLSRIAFIAIVSHAVKTVFTADNVKMAFEATGVIYTFQPSKNKFI